MEEKYESPTAFLDLFLNIMLCFILLFSLSFLMMNKEKAEDSKVKSKAELLITMTWDEDRNDDVDLWIEDPLGNLVCFLRRDQGFLHLDRDDLGLTNDSITLPNGERKEIKLNQEIVTVRGIIQGEYTVNGHMYSKRSPKDQSTKVTVKLDDINPSVKLITQEEKIMERNGEEQTFFRFELDEEGDVVNISDLKKKLARTGPNGPNYNY